MSKGLLNETLDILAPTQEEVSSWETILARAGIEIPAPVRRPLWKRTWVIVLVVLVVALVPLAAIGSEQGWLFLDHGKVMPGMPKPVSEILEVKSGSWSGHDWKLAAYRALVRRGGVGAGIDGLCYLLQSADGDQGLCAPIPPWHAGASSESSTPESVTYIGGSFNNSAGAPDKTGWLFGMVRNNVAEVDIHFEDGRVIDAPTFAAPEALAAPVRFYGVELSDYRMYLTISKLVGLDAQGQIAACSADPAESSKTCS